MIHPLFAIPLYMNTIGSLDYDEINERLLELDWENFMKNKRYNKRMKNYNISVTNKLREEFKIIYKNI